MNSLDLALSDAPPVAANPEFVWLDANDNGSVTVVALEAGDTVAPPAPAPAPAPLSLPPLPLRGRPARRKRTVASQLKIDLLNAPGAPLTGKRKRTPPAYFADEEYEPMRRGPRKYAKFEWICDDADDSDQSDNESSSPPEQQHRYNSPHTRRCAQLGQSRTTVVASQSRTTQGSRARSNKLPTVPTRKYGDHAVGAGFTSAMHYLLRHAGFLSASVYDPTYGPKCTQQWMNELPTPQCNLFAPTAYMFQVREFQNADLSNRLFGLWCYWTDRATPAAYDRQVNGVPSLLEDGVDPRSAEAGPWWVRALAHLTGVAVYTWPDNDPNMWHVDASRPGSWLAVSTTSAPAASKALKVSLQWSDTDWWQLVPSPYATTPSRQLASPEHAVPVPPLVVDQLLNHMVEVLGQSLAARALYLDTTAHVGHFFTRLPSARRLAFETDSNLAVHLQRVTGKPEQVVCVLPDHHEDGGITVDLVNRWMATQKQSWPFDARVALVHVPSHASLREENHSRNVDSKVAGIVSAWPMLVDALGLADHVFVVAPLSWSEQDQIPTCFDAWRAAEFSHDDDGRKDTTWVAVPVMHMPVHACSVIFQGTKPNEETETQRMAMYYFRVQAPGPRPQLQPATVKALRQDAVRMNVQPDTYRPSDPLLKQQCNIEFVSRILELLLKRDAAAGQAAAAKPARLVAPGAPAPMTTLAQGVSRVFYLDGADAETTNQLIQPPLSLAPTQLYTANWNAHTLRTIRALYPTLFAYSGSALEALQYWCGGSSEASRRKSSSPMPPVRFDAAYLDFCGFLSTQLPTLMYTLQHCLALENRGDMAVLGITVLGCREPLPREQNATCFDTICARFEQCLADARVRIVSNPDRSEWIYNKSSTMCSRFVVLQKM